MGGNSLGIRILSLTSSQQVSGLRLPQAALRRHLCVVVSPLSRDSVGREAMESGSPAGTEPGGGSGSASPRRGNEPLRTGHEISHV